MKWGALANPGARRRPAEATLSGIAADKAAGTAYEIINQSINRFSLRLPSFFILASHYPSLISSWHTIRLAMEALEEADIINNHPIKEGLVAFRHQFESSRTRLDFVGSAVADVLSTELGPGYPHCLATNYLAKVCRRSGP